MPSDRCLSVLSVGDVGTLWPNGWMHQDETWHGGMLGPGYIVLDEDPAPPPKKGGGGTVPSNFRLMYVVAKRLDGSRCYSVQR